MNPKKNGQRDEWAACQQGEIGQLAQQLKARRRFQSVQRGAGLVVVFLIVSAAGYFVVVDNPSNGDLEFGGMTCSEVGRHVSEFIADTLHPELKSKIQQHLAHCPGCRERVEQLRLKTGRPAANRPPIEKNLPVAVAMVAPNGRLTAVSFSP